MSDLISRQAAIDALNNIEIPRNASWYQYYQQALTAVYKLPPAQPEPSQVAKDIARIVENGQDMRVIGQERIRGRWTMDNACSECGCQPWFSGDIHNYNFCPHCGADMSEVTT